MTDLNDMIDQAMPGDYMILVRKAVTHPLTIMIGPRSEFDLNPCQPTEQIEAIFKQWLDGGLYE